MDKGHPIQDIYRTPAGYPMAASDVRGSIGYPMDLVCYVGQPEKRNVVILEEKSNKDIKRPLGATLDVQADSSFTNLKLNCIFDLM